MGRQHIVKAHVTVHLVREKTKVRLESLQFFLLGGGGGVGETPEEGHRQEFLCFFSSCRIVGLQIGGRSERNF